MILGVLVVAALAFSAWALDDSGRAESSLRPMRGTFTGPTRYDASGKAALVRSANGEWTLRLDDFSMRPAPELFVYLVPWRSGGEIARGTNLGRLKTTLGDSEYRVPKDLDVGATPTVVVWCNTCKSGFAAAELDPVT